MNRSLYALAAKRARLEYPDADTDSAHEAGEEGFMVGACWIAHYIMTEVLGEVSNDPDDWEREDMFSSTYALSELLGLLPPEEGEHNRSICVNCRAVIEDYGTYWARITVGGTYDICPEGKSTDPSVIDAPHQPMRS